jgi:hypothetical protein
MRAIRTLFLFVLVLGTALRAQAQLPTVDITLAPLESGSVQVRLRPDGNFNGLVSSLVFTVRWLDADAASLGGVSQISPANFFMPFSKSGPEQVSGIYRYQVFAGFSLVTLEDLETAWVGGEEVIIGEVAVNGGPSLFEIVNDDWTGDINNNGDYYISLNGQDRTGEIYTFSTGGISGGLEQGGLSVLPNPAFGSTTLTMDLSEQVGSVDLRLIDPVGHVVWTAQRNAGPGRFVETLDLQGYAAGAYLLQVRLPQAQFSRRVVVTGR